MTEDDQWSARNETKFLLRLDHPNVIKIVDFFENFTNIIIVLPLMQMTLLDYTKHRNQPCDEEEGLKIFKMIAQGIGHCHEKGVIHCDLKPENILVNLD